MKRILTLLTVCLMASVAMAQNAGIMVSVNKGQGGLKFFRSNQLMQAIEAAEINDTIYFSAGSFDFNQLPEFYDYNGYTHHIWPKPLVVIGAGAQDDYGTRISMGGTLYLKFDYYTDNEYSPDYIKIDERNVSFEGMSLPSNWVSPGSEVNKLTFRNFRGYVFNDRNDMLQNEDGAEDWEKPHTYIHKVDFENCYMDQINLEERNVYYVEVYNSKVGSVKGACAEVLEGQPFTLDHCRIYNTDGFDGLIMNSLICDDYSSSTTQIQSSGIYWRNNNYSQKDSACVDLQNSFSWEGDDVPLSNDGRPTTSMGLTADYTLYPSYPTLDVNKSEIDYDSINKQISITVKLLGVKDEVANEQ